MDLNAGRWELKNRTIDVDVWIKQPFLLGRPIGKRFLATSPARNLPLQRLYFFYSLETNRALGMVRQLQNVIGITVKSF